MRRIEIEHSQTILTIFGKSAVSRLRSQKFKHLDLFRGAFIVLLRGYARSLTPQTDSLFCQKTGTSSEYIYQAERVQRCTLATSDVILI